MFGGKTTNAYPSFWQSASSGLPGVPVQSMRLSLLFAVSLYEILAQDAERHAWLQRSEILGDTVDIHLMPVKTFQHTVEGVCTECVAGVDDFHTVFRRDSFDYHARGVVRAANADKHKCIGLFSNLRRQCLNALQLL